MDQFSPQDIKALIQSPAGQQLLAMLQQDPAALARASRMAKAGDYAGVKSAFASMMQDPNVLKLLQQLGGGNNG